MTSPTIVRRGSIIAAVTGAAWSTASVLSLVVGGPSHYLDYFLILPVALTLAAATDLHLVQRAQSGRLGRAAFWLLLIGTPIMLVGQVGIAGDVSEVKSIFLPIGMVTWIGGLILMGIATARARVIPIAHGILIAMSQLLAVLAGLAFSPIVPLSNTGSYTGAIGHGVVWISIALALRALQRSPEPAASSRGITIAHQ